MTKQAKATNGAASVNLAAPFALDSTLALGGYVATVVVRREDGQPMTENDRLEAERLIAASDESGRTDAEVDALATAFEARASGSSRSSRSSRKPAPKGATKRQPSRANASKTAPASPAGTTTTRSRGRTR